MCSRSSLTSKSCRGSVDSCRSSSGNSIVVSVSVILGGSVVLVEVV